MPNLIDATGIQVSTRAELLAKKTADLKRIYGDDINLESDSPDGQRMNIEVQEVLDVQDLSVQVYNSMDPDNAYGVVLDQRVAINGIQRRAGTYTTTNITLVNSQSINLQGLSSLSDIEPEINAFTISDSAGNNWYLQTTQVGLAAGSHVLVFRAAVPGAQLTTQNTITTLVSVVIGVTSVNNPTTYLSLGVNEESDALLKIRRSQSTGLASAYIEGLIAALKNIPGVTDAYVSENDTDVTDSDGTPSHSIWVIMAGSALPVDIATVIYRKRTGGCGMRGDQEYTVTRLDGSPFEVRWDNVILQNIFVMFGLESIDGITPPNVGAIRTNLPTIYQPGVNQYVDVNGLATAVQSIDPNSLVVDSDYFYSDVRIGFSTGVQQRLTIQGIPTSGQWRANFNGNNSALINWNDSQATVQTKIRAMPLLSAATVIITTPPLEGVHFDITLSTNPLYNVEDLFTATGVTLVDSFANPLTITTALQLEKKLLPNSKQKQFILNFQNIVINPFQISPSASIVPTGSTITFRGEGGYGTYTFSIFTNNSGATINASTGAYVAGPSIGIDEVWVQDEFRNLAIATVNVQ